MSDETRTSGGYQPPANLDAERSVLGSFLRDPALIGVHGDGLEPHDFYLERHQLIFNAMRECLERGTGLDPVLVAEELHKTKHLEAAGGPGYLAELVDEVGTTAMIANHITLVREKSQRRRLISAATEVASRGYAVDVTLSEYLEEAESKVFQVLMGSRASPMRSLRDVLHLTIEQIQLMLREGGAVAGLSTGFDDLDRITLGLHPSDLTIVAARPAMGKTAFAMSIATDVALRQQKRVAVFSLEMSSEQIAMRMLSGEACVNLKDIRTGKPRMDDWRRIIEASDRLSMAPLFIDDSPGITLGDLRARCRRLALDGGLDLVVIDYLQLMRARSDKVSREQQIAEISRGLKALAKELNLPVVALSQLNRGLEARTDKRPMLSDLREFGAFEQDADVIMFVYRDEYYHPDTEDKGVAEIIVGKQRNGPTDTAKLAFVGEYTKFAGLARSAEF